jgi:hypothetical protein
MRKALPSQVERLSFFNRLLLEFDLQARISLYVVDNLVVASHKIGDSDAAAFGTEFPDLVEIERNELLDLKDVDPVGQACIVRQAFGDGQAALPGDEDRSKAVVEVVPAALDQCFARRRGDVNGDIAGGL